MNAEPQWINVLARYNTERSRGVAHTVMWVEAMAALQARFDSGSDASTSYPRMSINDGCVIWTTPL